MYIQWNKDLSASIYILDVGVRLDFRLSEYNIYSTTVKCAIS